MQNTPDENAVFGLETIADSLTELSIAGSDFFTTDVDKSGFLEMTIVKDGQKAQERVFAVLKRNVLYTFGKPEDAASGLEPLDTLSIDGCKGKTGSTPEAIELEEIPGLSVSLNTSARVSSFTNKRWVFKAESKDDAQSWLTSINKYLGLVAGIQLEPAQLEAIEKLRNKIATGSEKIDSKSILRLLNAKNFDVDAAAALHAETIAWRKQFGVDTMSSESIAHILRSGLFTIPPGFSDKKGRPVMIMRPGNLEPKNMKLLDIVRGFVYILEGALASRPPGVEQIVAVIDFNGMNRSKFDPRVPRYIIGYIQNYYSGLFASILVVNQPLFFRVIWSVISQWIEPSLRSVISIVGDAKKNLRSWVDPDQSTVEYGGVLDYNHEKWVENHLAASKNMGSSEINDSLQLAFSDVAPSAISNPNKVGYLTKQGGIVKNWKKRYCVLKGKIFLYYSGSDASKPQGYVDLSSASIDPNGYSGKSHAFTVNTSSRVWIFVAESESEKKEWINALNGVLH